MPPVNVHIVLRSDDCVLMAMANNYLEADVWGVRGNQAYDYSGLADTLPCHEG